MLLWFSNSGIRSSAGTLHLFLPPLIKHRTNVNSGSTIKSVCAASDYSAGCDVPSDIDCEVSSGCDQKHQGSSASLNSNSLAWTGVPTRWDGTVSLQSHCDPRYSGSCQGYTVVSQNNGGNVVWLWIADGNTETCYLIRNANCRIILKTTDQLTVFTS
jgi:hypothetical protein